MKNKEKENNKNILSITQIKISLPNKEIELTSDEARRVYEELGQLFKIENKKENIPEKYLEEYKELFEKNRPQKEYVPYPIWVERDPAWNPPYWEIWCDQNPGKIWYGTDATNGQFEDSTLSINLTNNIK